MQKDSVLRGTPTPLFFKAATGIGALPLTDIYKDGTSSSVSVEPAATSGTMVGLVTIKQGD